MDELHNMELEDAMDYIESLGHDSVAEMVEELERAIQEELYN